MDPTVSARKAMGLADGAAIERDMKELQGERIGQAAAR
jgi:hypothetical protein